jgi:hypothetical protein
VTLRMTAGQVCNEHVEHAVGTEQRPKTDAEIETKVTGLCEPYLTQQRLRTDRLLLEDRKLGDAGACWSRERGLNPMRDPRCLRGSPGSPPKPG